jgi:hypothetical protein
MLKTISKFFIYITIISSITYGCKKEPVDHGAPAMNFIIDSGYLYSDTAIACGDTAMIGIHCTWNGTDLIKTVNLYLNDDLASGPFPIRDSTGKEFNYKVKITKSIKTVEKWEFEIIDSKNHISRINLNVYIDNSGGNIVIINAITGVQRNPSIGNYFDFTNKINWTQAQAEKKQAFIDLVAGYDAEEKSFLSSPGSSNLFGLYDFSAWTTKNLTLFCPTTLTREQFDLTSKDNLLKSSFHPENAVDSIRAFKTNQIYSFKTQGNRYGLLAILNIATSESGFITFDVKIQE